MGEIALINSVSQKDVKNTGNVNNKVLNSKNSTVSIHGDKILQNKDVSLSSSDMFAVLSDASQRIADNANNLKEMGVSALQSVAVTVSNKAVNIISSASNECFKYDGELNKILEEGRRPLGFPRRTIFRFFYTTVFLYTKAEGRRISASLRFYISYGDPFG